MNDCVHSLLCRVLAEEEGDRGLKRLELRTIDTAPFRSPLKLVLVTLTALIFVALVAPFTIRQMKVAWSKPIPSLPTEPEAWPTPPATYAPRALAPASALRSTPSPSPLPPPLPAPVWQELNYLTSVEFTTSSVVVEQRTTDLELGGVQLLNGVVTDRLLLKAVAKAQLGINLGQVSHVEITGTTISLIAPNPEVVSIELLPDQSQIYDSVQVWFLSQYQGLEKDALEKARRQLHDEVAGNASMMKLASELARVQLTEFLHKAGFTKVNITFPHIDFTNED